MGSQRLGCSRNRLERRALVIRQGEVYWFKLREVLEGLALLFGTDEAAEG